MEHDVAYWEHPHQVVWVQTPVRQLRGACYYFVAGDTYGAWYDPDHDHDYAGPPVAYRYVDGVEERIPFQVPPDAAIYEGYMLTDEQARFLGLI